MTEQNRRNLQKRRNWRNLQKRRNWRNLQKRRKRRMTLKPATRTVEIDQDRLAVKKIHIVRIFQLKPGS